MIDQPTIAICESCNVSTKCIHLEFPLQFENKKFIMLCSQCHEEIIRLIKQNETWEKAVPLPPTTLMRKNEGKARFSLLDWTFIEEMAGIMMFGIKKGYPENNWKNKVENMGDIDDSMLRHVIADMKGEFIDSDSGLPHVAHVAVNAMFKYYQVNKYGTK